MKNKIILVGAGNIGRRYLQGIAKLDTSLDIDVYDVNKNSLKVAEQKYYEIDTRNKQHKISFNSAKKETNCDLIIIATSSYERLKVIEQYKNKLSTQFWLIEKVIEQSSNNINNILSHLHKDSKVVAWVNTPRRIMKFYTELKKKINLNIPKKIYVSGGLWGMACNTIHFIDMVEWITNQKIVSVNTKNVDNKWIKSKRIGFYEITGELSVAFSKGTQLILSSDPMLKDYIINIEFTENDFWQIDEINGIMKHSSGKKIIGKVDYVSDISGDLVQDILSNGSCNLTNIEESCRQHKVLIDELLKHWNIHNNKQDTIVPIT
ncbi:hypothetical protein [Candidatus Pelagibacter sp.]|uniref:hypothetical protein n=1 Tax=Candidatus Pelagibacter sp. TaxID=2024849 RepID=UPI003F87F3AB